MNTKTATTVAAALALSLGLGSVQADAATSQASSKLHLKETGTVSHASGRVIHLGTILVTPPKAAKVDFSKRRGSTAYLGTVHVSAADSTEARMAARYAKSNGAAFLGVVEVTREDSMDARYAQRLAHATAGTAYLGTVLVKPAGAQARALAGLANLETRLAENVRFVVFGTLAFDRAGG